MYGCEDLTETQEEEQIATQATHYSLFAQKKLITHSCGRMMNVFNHVLLCCVLLHLIMFYELFTQPHYAFCASQFSLAMETQ